MIINAATLQLKILNEVADGNFSGAQKAKIDSVVTLLDKFVPTLYAETVVTVEFSITEIIYTYENNGPP